MMKQVKKDLKYLQKELAEFRDQANRMKAKWQIEKEGIQNVSRKT